MKEMKNERRFPLERNKKRDPGLVSFLTTYYKQDNVDNEVQLYICLIVYEDDDDDI